MTLLLCPVVLLGAICTFNGRVYVYIMYRYTACICLQDSLQRQHNHVHKFY